MKSVLILGGSSGIGKATAERFAKEGFCTMIACEDLGEAEKVVKDINAPNGCMATKADVRVEGHIERLAATVKEKFAKLDVLVNSVGISRSQPAIESDFQEWDEQLRVMMYGTVKCCRALVPCMNEGGRIINITSIHHTRVAKGSSAYGMAKAAITQYTRSLALELAHRKILVNAVAPGFINTPMSVKENFKNELESEWFIKNYIEYDHLPLKRPGSAHEVAGVVYFLSGSDASYITGSVVTVDGGLTITF